MLCSVSTARLISHKTKAESETDELIEVTKEMLLEMADEIRDYIENNSNSDGTFNFDKERAWVALDFTKKEIGAKNE